MIIQYINRLAPFPFGPIASLYAAREKGVWYDPSDLTTMFQDAAGTQPITADTQTVGLALDKHSWAGKTLAQVIAGQPNLASPLDFTSSWTIAGGANTAQTANSFTRSAAGGPYKALLVIGKLYRVTLDVTVTGTTFSLGNTAGTSPTGAQALVFNQGSGTYSLYWTAIAAELYFRLAGAGSLAVNSFSIKEIPGNHSPQTNVAARRTYRTNGPLSWLWDDNSDDAMPVTFGNLGSNCTVAYVTASGVTILTSQTISGVYNVPGKGANLYGCIIIDRALTTAETASVTAWLKKKAGL